MKNRALLPGLLLGLLLALGLLPAFPAGAAAQTATTIASNGDPANRIDFVILGDGYTAAQLGQYALDVDNVVQRFFAQEPFREYQRYFNVHRIDVASAQSGVDHPELVPPVFRNTALNSTYNCAGIARLICADNGIVESLLSSLLLPNQRDMVLVLVNDPVYGGSGGYIAVASLDPLVVEIVLHELGHSFGQLADEYGGPPPPNCDNTVEPFAANATRETRRAFVKWGAWIAAATPLPTTTTTPGVPGLYQGAQYCDTGLYRPTNLSKMRGLGLPFEQINSEQLVLQSYGLVSPLDASAPAAGAFDVARGQRPAFSAATPAPRTHALSVAWSVDGGTAVQGGGFTLDSTALPLGAHTLTVTAADATPFVRSDPSHLLTEKRIWALNVRDLQNGEFLDVLTIDPFYAEIQKIALRGVTLGCGGGNYCPDGRVTREQMAAFLIRALGDPNPPTPISQRFADAPPSNPFYAFIEQMAVRGITLGCGSGNYCPSGKVTREQMAAFLIRALGQPDPPTPASQRFNDVPPSNPFYAFIEEMAARGITLGCGGGNYCPSGEVTRAQMAAFLTRAFGF